MFVNENEIPLRVYENYITNTHISRNVNVGCGGVVLLEELQNYAAGIKFLVSQLQTRVVEEDVLWYYSEMFYSLSCMCVLIEQPLVEFVQSICTMPQRKEDTVLFLNNLSQLLQKLECYFVEYREQKLSVFQLKTKVADFIFRSFHSLCGECCRKQITLETMLEGSINARHVVIGEVKDSVVD